MRAKPTLLVVACGTTAAALAYYYWWRRRPKRRWAHGVEVRQRRIPDAGDGLFAARRFEAGAVLGEYRGQVLSLLQAYKLEDRDYLMGGFGLNAHVAARFALAAPEAVEAWQATMRAYLGGRGASPPRVLVLVDARQSLRALARDMLLFLVILACGVLSPPVSCGRVERGTLLL